MFAVTAVLVCILGSGVRAWPAPATRIHYGNGLTADFAFTRGPRASRRAFFESYARVEIHSEARDARRVRTIAFDAVRRAGRRFGTLTEVRAPKITPIDAATWEVSNIYFTMEKKWEGKLSLEFDDGTEQTEWFSIDVPAR